MHQLNTVNTPIMSSVSDPFNKTSGWKEPSTPVPSSYNLPKFHTKSAMKNAETFIYQTKSAMICPSKNHGGNAHTPSCGSCVLTCNSSGRSKTKAWSDFCRVGSHRAQKRRGPNSDFLVLFFVGSLCVGWGVWVGGD